MIQDQKITCVKTNDKSLRAKMELPCKTLDPKIQNVKVPNGLHKDVITSKGLPGGNGLIKLPNLSPTHEHPNLDRTLSMNQVNTNHNEAKCNDRVKDLETDRSNQKGLEGFEGIMKSCDNHIRSDCRNSNENVLGCNQSSSEHMHISDNDNCQSQDGGKNPVNSVSGCPLPGPNGTGQTAPGVSPGSSIPKPTALVKGTTKPPKDINPLSIPAAAKLKGDVMHRKLDPNTVAMVSPMPSISDLMSESSHSNSNSTGQSNSSDSSVIYRPSSESGSEIKTIPNRKIDTTFEQMEKVGCQRDLIIDWS